MISIGIFGLQIKKASAVDSDIQTQQKLSQYREIHHTSKTYSQVTVMTQREGLFRRRFLF